MRIARQRSLNVEKQEPGSFRSHATGWVAGVLLAAAAGWAADVELQPGVLQGTVQPQGAPSVQTLYVRAYSQDGFSGNASYQGSSYSLTLAGDKSWRLETECYWTSGQDQAVLRLSKNTYVSVPAGSTVTRDVLDGAGIIRGSISADGATLKSYTIYASAGEAGDSYYGWYYGRSGAATFSLPMVIDSRVAVSGSALFQLTSGTQVTVPLAQKTEALTAAGVDVAWHLDLSNYDASLGSVAGSVALGGSVQPSSHWIELYDGSWKSVSISSSSGSYSFNGVQPGTKSLYLHSYFAAPFGYLRQYSSPTVIAGALTTADFLSDLGVARGKLNVTGYFGLADFTGSSVGANGIYNTPSHNGYASDTVSLSDGSFDLVLSPGSWNIYSLGLSKFRSTLSDYLNTTIQIYDYSRAAEEVVPLGEITVPDFNVETTKGQITFDVAEPAGAAEVLISNARLTASKYDRNTAGQVTRYVWVNSSGPSVAAAQPSVQIVAEPGVYQATAEAMVNNSWVQFAKFDLTLNPPQSTPTGSGVVVQPSPSVPVTLTFDNVTEPGVTTVTEVPVGPNPDAGFRVWGPGGDPLYYDISTTATFDGSVKVCLQYTDTDDGSVTDMPDRIEQKLRLWHRKTATGAWEDITLDGSHDLMNNTICGITTSFSLFALVYSSDPQITSVTLDPSPAATTQNVQLSASFSDADTIDIHTASINWGDGTTTSGQVDSATRTITGQHAYAADADYQVQVTVTDAAGNSASGTAALTVYVPNRAPVAVCKDVTVEAQAGCTASASINDGSSDPDGDSIQLTQNPAGPYSLGQTLVTLSVTDTFGASSTCQAIVTVVDTTQPTITAPATVVVGTDPGTCTATGVDLGQPQVSDNCAVQLSNDAPATFTKGVTVVTWTATDASGNQASATQQVTVENPAPTAAILQPGIGMVVPVGTTLNLEGSFTDNAGDVHTASWTVGGTAVAAVVDETNRKVTGSHLLGAPGVYAVTLSVSDACGQSATVSSVGDATIMVVVYDPNGGFVTGGGRIASPPGALVTAPELTGNATFGFVSKYERGATVPSGNTQFHFQVADFKFQSTAYDWLVVSGARAQFKGAGRVNGSGTYGFLLTATDGQISGGGGTDNFRIKIWDINDGTTVYDNVPESSDELEGANPQAIAAGSVVIHKAR